MKLHRVWWEIVVLMALFWGAWLVLVLTGCARPGPPDAGYDFCRDGRMTMTVKERRVLCEPKQLELDGGTP